MNYKQTLDYLYTRLPVFHLTGGTAYKPGLKNTLLLLEALDNPHLRFKSIHIAGTNGKGSVSHMLAAVLQQADYKTGLYTSPHLIDFGERIRINGTMISQDFVVEFIHNYRPLIDKVQPSFFELSMAMAFTYFAENAVDIAIVETGLGGRLDSTNILLPELSVITNIGLDHTEFLGNTLEKIAFEKAGIIKPGIPAVIGEILPETRSVFMQKTTETISRLIDAEVTDPVQFVRIEPQHSVVSYENKEFECGLTGMYQLKNIGIVMAVTRELTMNGWIINETAIRSGLKNVCNLTGLRGRWEKLSEQPFIFADTAHNVQGIKALVQQLNLYNVDEVHIIIGMVNDKDLRGVLQLLPSKARYYFTQAQVKRALPAHELQSIGVDYQLHGQAYSSIIEATSAALKNASNKDLILITGSNFVVGEAISLV
jgi:dihydrofolate synthase/folylpolyglutamate synthase